VIYRTRSDSSRWEGRIWDKGNSRSRPRAGSRGASAPPPTREGIEVEIKVPKTPEEKYPCQPRYHIRFAGGLSIEVRPPGTDTARGFWARLREAGPSGGRTRRQRAGSSPGTPSVFTSCCPSKMPTRSTVRCHRYEAFGAASAKLVSLNAT
jgi:hypothetical protein